MLLGGDELCRTQEGNNNGYCQDNELSWYDWKLADESGDMLKFVTRLIALREAHPVFRRSSFFVGTRAGELPDVWWCRPDGRRMARRDWDSDDGQLGVFLNGEALRTPGRHGEVIKDDSFLLLFNANHELATFVLPTRRFGSKWSLVLSTFTPDREPELFEPRQRVMVEGRSLVLLQRA
jgi:glycogen operon protein